MIHKCYEKTQIEPQPVLSVGVREDGSKGDGVREQSSTYTSNYIVEEYREIGVKKLRKT
jgi:hypothetical protein